MGGRNKSGHDGVGGSADTRLVMPGPVPGTPLVMSTDPGLDPGRGRAQNGAPVEMTDWGAGRPLRRPYRDRPKTPGIPGGSAIYFPITHFSLDMGRVLG